jgi:hypothetical protein
MNPEPSTVKFAGVPLNRMALALTKEDPRIVIFAPTLPLAGEKPATVGGRGLSLLVIDAMVPRSLKPCELRHPPYCAVR